jgi:hypothetical protein
MNVRTIKISITAAALLVASAHLIWPEVTIDAITVALLIVAVVPWLSSVFKSVELPGGIKVEYRDLEKIEQRAREAGLIAEEPLAPTPECAFQSISSIDPNLALAGLRIELEKRLVRLAESRELPIPRRGLKQLLIRLNEAELVTGGERALLSDLADLLNSAVHGATIEQPAFEWALEVGPRILKALEQRADTEEYEYQGIT